MILHPNVWLGLAITGGAVMGFGFYMLATQLVPTRPALGPALRRLHPLASSDVTGVTAAPKRSWELPLRPPAADLNILGKTPERHLLSVGLSAGMGFVFPLLITLIVVILQLPIPIVFPLGASLLMGLGFATLVHLDVRSKAAFARAEFVRALCTYAGLTAHQVRSGHGAVEAMERAARICDGWPYTRLRTALLTAQLRMRTPWEELKTLSTEIDVVELGSFADIMHTAGTDGAQVYETLRAQAGSLRDQIRARAIEQAKTRTSKLDIPSTMLIIILLVLIVYPLIVNMFNQR